MLATLGRIGVIVVGIATILGFIVTVMQLQQTTEQNSAQATLVGVLEKQLQVQSQIATLGADQLSAGPTATAAAKRVAELESTAAALSTQRAAAESLVTPSLPTTLPATPAVKPTTDRLVTPRPVVPSSAPQLVAPAYGEYKSPITFSWSGSSNVLYQVTLRHVDKGFIHSSDWIQGFSWTLDIPGHEFGNWEWYVTTADGTRSNAWSFVFNPFAGKSDGQPSLFGDLNGDCVIDQADIDLVAAHWGTKVGDPNYDPYVDLDGDGDVDIRDVALVANRYGQTCR